MIKKTLKNVRRLKQVALAMSSVCTAVLMQLAYYASVDRINNLVSYIISGIALTVLSGGCFESFVCLDDMQEEMEVRHESKND